MLNCYDHDAFALGTKELIRHQIQQYQKYVNQLEKAIRNIGSITAFAQLIKMGDGSNFTKSQFSLEKCCGFVRLIYRQRHGMRETIKRLKTSRLDVLFKVDDYL